MDIDILIRKYYEGKSSPEEKTELYRLLLNEPGEKFQKVMADLWEDLQVVPSMNEEQSDRIYGKVHQTIQPEFRTTRWNRRNILAIAASLTLLLTFTGIWLLYQPATWQEISTGYGEIRNLELPDGSLVSLNANSSIRFASNFGRESTRELHLKGEAFFEVKPLTCSSGKVPFLVQTERLVVQVVGTKFNVKSRGSLTEVVLDEGKVNLIGKLYQLDTIALEPGQIAHLDQQEKLNVTQVKNTNNYTSWTWNELYFEDKSLKEIATQVMDHFGIRMILTPGIENYQFTGSSPADDPEVLLLTIQKSFGLQLEQDGSTYYLKP